MVDLNSPFEQQFEIIASIKTPGQRQLAKSSFAAKNLPMDMARMP